MICLTCLSPAPPLPHWPSKPERMEFVSFRFHNDILSNGKPSVKVTEGTRGRSLLPGSLRRRDLL